MVSVFSPVFSTVKKFGYWNKKHKIRKNRYKYLKIRLHIIIIWMIIIGKSQLTKNPLLWVRAFGKLVIKNWIYKNKNFLIY